MQILSLILFSWYATMNVMISGFQFVKNSQQCHKVTGYELSSLFLSLLLPLSSSFVCVCLFLIFIFIVAKVVFTCEDVKSDGSRFEDGGFASVVARVRRTGVPNIVMIIFAFNYFLLEQDWLYLSTLIPTLIPTGRKRQDYQMTLCFSICLYHYIIMLYYC